MNEGVGDAPPRRRRRSARRVGGPPTEVREPRLTLSRPVPKTRAARLVLGTEVLGLLRDRRALFSAFVVPMLLYPFLFLGNSWLERLSRESMESRPVTVALDLSAMPGPAADRLRELLRIETPIELVEIDAQRLLVLGSGLETGRTVSPAERAAVKGLLDAAGDVLLVARPLGLSPEFGLKHYHDSTDDDAREASRRVGRAVRALHDEMSAGRIRAVLGSDPARGLEALPVDVASRVDQSGARLGGYLPLMAVLVLLAGASYAALSAFAGERESGTLETLLVQPVPAISLASAKFLAVLAAGVVALVLNGGSVLACLHLGLGTLPGAGQGAASSVDVGRLAIAAFLFLPAAVFLCAILCLACGRARTFREGQQMLFPLLLCAIVPTIPSTQADVALDPFLAAIPICGPALALRDALRGEVALGLALWMFVANCGWAALAVSRLAGVLDSERWLQNAGNDAENALRRVQSRVAVRWAVVAVFAVYLVGSQLQSWSVELGLALTLWALLLPLALLAARGTAARAGESVRQALWFGLPHPLHAVGALLLAPACVFVVKHLFELQAQVLPLPSSLGEVELFPSHPENKTLWMLALVALSPAICEELFFRGALLSGLRRDLSTWRVVLLQMLFFGAVHLSIYRFAPTALLGAVLALVTLRARSLVPAMILHGVYNALLVLEQAQIESRSAAWLFDPRLAWVGLAGAALFLARSSAWRGGSAGPSARSGYLPKS